MSIAAEHQTDVLIVGAGPVGLTLACELRRHGVSCRLIDKYAEFPITSRALGIQARTLEVFDDIGVVDPVIAQGATIYGITFLQGERAVATVKLRLDRRARPDQPYRGVVILNQAKVEDALRDRLGSLGGAVERSHELVEFYEEEEAVVATVKDTTTGETKQVRADYLVGCDGAHSVVRKALDLTFEGSAYPEHFVLGDMEAEGGYLPLDTAVAWLDDEGMLASFPFPELGLRRLIAVVYPDDESGEVPGASLELFQRLLAERAGDTRVRLSNPVWLSNYRVSRRMVNHYRKGRAFVAGDAAHIHSPSGGQGMNTGIQDAYNLGWKLALVTKGKAPSRLLDTYEEERLPVARAVLNQTDTNQRLFISNHPVMQFVRERALVPLMEIPAVTDAIVYRGSELSISYRGSSLSQNQKLPLRRTSLLPTRDDERVRLLDKLVFSRAPHAGDRAPDARCHLANAGETTTLFDQFRGPHFTLLLFAGLTPKDVSYSQLASVARQVGRLFGKEVEVRIIASANARPAALHWDGAMLLDSNQEVHKLYGAKAQSLYLVRPDGYIGFRAQPAAAEPLLEYLSSLFSLDNLRVYWEDPENTSATSNTFPRELRVMFSRSRSPVPLRLAKWIVFLSLARRLYGARWFWMWALGSPLAGVATHLLYRHKTRGWTRPWGGWKNAKTPNPKESS